LRRARRVGAEGGVWWKGEGEGEEEGEGGMTG